MGTSEGNLWKSTNGGSDWKIINTQFDAVLAIYFTSTNNGWFISTDKINETSDGGESWTENFAIDTLGFRDIFFINDSIGFVLAGHIGQNPNQSKILRTTNGGERWIVRLEIDEAALLNIGFADEELIWTLGYETSNKVVYKTTDLGINWESIYKERVIIPDSDINEVQLLTI